MRPYHSETRSVTPEKIDLLVLNLTRRLQMLNDDISAEEERTRCRDRRDSAYSILARTLISRRDNLSATIAALNERSSAIKAPELA